MDRRLSINRHGLELWRLMVHYSAAGAITTLLNLVGVVMIVRTISVEKYRLGPKRCMHAPPNCETDHNA